MEPRQTTGGAGDSDVRGLEPRLRDPRRARELRRRRTAVPQQGEGRQPARAGAPLRSRRLSPRPSSRRLALTNSSYRNCMAIHEVQASGLEYLALATELL